MVEPGKSTVPVDRDRKVDTEDEPKGLRASLRSLARSVAHALSQPFAEIGFLAQMGYETFFWGVRPPYRWRAFIESMEFVGVGSVFLITMTSLFSGAVLGLQLVNAFRDLSAETQTGAVVGIALTRELGPVLAALMVSSRAGSAMTTELGSMRVSGQIDALTTMAVNPVQYLVVPRVLAGITMVPLLTLLFDVVGMWGSWFICVQRLGLDEGIYLNNMAWQVDWDDVRQGLIKGAVFGGTVALIACRQGFFATGGAAGVGHATNRSVVHSAMAILLLDYIITAVILGEGF